MSGVDLVIEDEWPAEFGNAGQLGVRGLLTCGHYGDICSERSSKWDFPDEEQICPEGCGERQFDLRLQAAIVDGWS